MWTLSPPLFSLYIFYTCIGTLVSSSYNTYLETVDKALSMLLQRSTVTFTVTTEYAAWRGCAFAISSLQLEEEGKTNWRAAVPGDGFKY